MKLEDALKMKSIPDHRLKAVLEILHTASVIDNLHLRYLKPYNLSVQQYNILRILRGSYPNSLTVQLIKERMVDLTPNTTRMVDKLLVQKLVTRMRSNKDRRKVFVRITAKGLEVMEKLDVVHQEFLRFTEMLSLDESDHLSNLLEKLRNSIK